MHVHEMIPQMEVKLATIFVGYRLAMPWHKSCTRNGGLTVAKDSSRAGVLTSSHERQQRERRAQRHGHVGQTILGRPREDLGGQAPDGETVERPRGDEEIGTRRGPGTAEEGGVDDGGEDGDAGLLDSDDEGALGSRRVEVQRRVAGRDQEADDEGAADVEDDQAEPHALDSLGDSAPGVGGLGGGDGGDLGAYEGEGGVDQDAEEPEEAALRSGDIHVLDKATRLPPVFESDGLVVRTPTGGDDDARDDEANDRDDLDRGEPEFHLAVGPVARKIDRVNDDEHEAHPHGVVADARGARRARVAGPVGDEHHGGGDLGGQDDDVEEPVDPAQGEAHLGRDVARGEGQLAAGDGELRDHLAQGHHDCEQQRGHDEVADEQTAGATVLEVVGRPQEQTGADDTADGNHLPVVVV